MRFHRLELEAFGPFADRQGVDFDELSAAGLFLLNGETGAGKTSVLDAICFALYGGLPGAREGSTRPAQRPCGRRCSAGGRLRVQHRRAPLRGHPLAGLGPPGQARRRHHHAAGPEQAAGAGARRLGGEVHPQ